MLTQYYNRSKILHLMNESLLPSIFACNVVVNSLLSFLTTALLIQLILVLFRIKQPRFKSLLLCLPLLKLVTDLFSYDFENWALTNAINPLLAEEGSRNLSLMTCYPIPAENIYFPLTQIVFSINYGERFSPGDLVALSISPLTLISLTTLILGISLTKAWKLFQRIKNSRQRLAKIVKNSKPYLERIGNQRLAKRVQQKRCQIILSSQVDTPLAFQRYICIPDNLIAKLTQEEFEAVLIHEMGHLCWFDALIRVICQFIHTLFWWVPMNWWIKRIENFQEKACDAAITRYKVEGADLASAIVKSAQSAKMRPPLLSSCFVQKESVINRLNLLLDDSITKKNSRVIWFQIVLATSLAFIVTTSKFWIF